MQTLDLDDRGKLYFGNNTSDTTETHFHVHQSREERIDGERLVTITQFPSALHCTRGDE